MIESAVKPETAGLWALTRRGDVSVPGRGALLWRCLAAGIPVASACSGQGACARCVVQVARGAEALSPMGERERKVLARDGLVQPGLRLSCMCRVIDDAAVVHVTTDYW